MLQTVGHGHAILLHHEGHDERRRPRLASEAMHQHLAFVRDAFVDKVRAFHEDVLDVLRGRIEQIHAFISEVLG